MRFDHARSCFDLSDIELAELDRRQQILLPLSSRLRPPLSDTQHAATVLGLQVRMVQRLLQRYRASNDPLAFLPRRRGRNQGSQGLSRTLEQIIIDAVEHRYAKPQRPSVKAVFRDICLACRQRGIAPPSLSTVRRRFVEADPRLVALKRQGRMAAQALKPVTGQQMAADYPLHVVQMDHGKADVVLVDSAHRRPIGRPWITFAIDLYSRCIAGYFVSLEAPSATSVGLCLANIAQDKEALLAQHQIEAHWPLMGKPTVLHTDNGKDFVSKALRQGCLAHGIRLEHRPVARPHYGGTIERVIGTFMKKMHDELPGTTFSNVHERGEYNSEGKAELTLTEFEHWLLLQITEYHATVHSSLGETPLARLQFGLETTRAPSAVENPRTYLIDFLPIMRRRVRRDGFHIDHVTYYDAKLDSYIARRKRFPDGFELRRDPRNLRFIWLRRPDTPGYLEIPYRRITNPDVTLWEHKETLKALNERSVRHLDEDLIMRTVVARRETIRQASLSSKRARRNVERLKGRPSSKSNNAEAPSPAPKPRDVPLEAFEVEVSW